MPMLINRVDALPLVLEPDSIYAVKRPEPGMLDLYFTGNSADQLRRVVNIDDINQAASGSVCLVSNIEQLNTIVDPKINLAYVVDPSPGNDGSEPASWYYRDPDLDTFIKASSSAKVNWSDISQGPISTPEELDDAVSKKHSHGNLAVLNKLNIDANGGLTFDGRSVLTIMKDEW